MDDDDTDADTDERRLSPQTLAVGTSPGTLQIPVDACPSRITVIRYSKDRHERHDAVQIADLPKLVSQGFDVVWVDVTGCGTLAVYEGLIARFGLPYLALEDHLNAPQRPKVEPYGDARFLLFNAIQVPGTVEMDQISIFLSGRVVFSFQHRVGDCFDAVRRRIATDGSQLRMRGADYLTYRLADAMVDSFFPELERLMRSLERLEKNAIEHANGKLLRRLHALKTEIRVLERAILPTRDAIGSLTRDDSVFAPETRPYIRDVHDHTQQLLEQIHLLSGLATDCGELVIGALDLKLNQIMKVLAAATCVFMPLNFVTSWYGMNFREPGMPELGWPASYPTLIALMAVSGALMLYWLRKRGWLGTHEDDSTMAEDDL